MKDLLLSARVIIKPLHVEISRCYSAENVKLRKYLSACRTYSTLVQPIKSMICGVTFTVNIVLRSAKNALKNTTLKPRFQNESTWKIFVTVFN